MCVCVCVCTEMRCVWLDKDISLETFIETEKESECQRQREISTFKFGESI